MRSDRFGFRAKAIHAIIPAAAVQSTVFFWAPRFFHRPFAEGLFLGGLRSQRLAFSRCACRIFLPRLFSTAYALALPALAKGAFLSLTVF